MWRYLVGGAAALALGLAGMFLFEGSASQEVALPPPPGAAAAPGDAPALPDRVAEATPKTREERRFDRYDKDSDDGVTREEYLATRRKAFAKLDSDGDGRLSFDEWAVKTTTKFAAADRDKSNILNRAEFATTAVKRKAPRRAANCPPPREDEG
ncbi:histidine kinase [Sphingomonas sp. S1-29]|uniref:histidine kinase n=1 Tax=Sphingomonas sp. S1-29 TaxID=2991074 RepID=UPI00224059B8|nr:histidine kinase [Sphingomonas sp. S1-29]UZK70114.1 histidine kinase [Sphingomonas sp. S1-29]